MGRPPRVGRHDLPRRRIPIRAVEGSGSRLLVGHRSAAFDPAGIETDHNLALPVDRFFELERDGVIGSLHGEALSFMGGITAPGRFVKTAAPEAARELAAAGVDVVFLTPV